MTAGVLILFVRNVYAFRPLLNCVSWPSMHTVCILLLSLFVRCFGFLWLYPNFFLPHSVHVSAHVTTFNYSLGPLLTSHCLASRTSTILSSTLISFQAKTAKRRNGDKWKCFSFHKLVQHYSSPNKSKRPSGRGVNLYVYYLSRLRAWWTCSPCYIRSRLTHCGPDFTPSIRRS